MGWATTLSAVRPLSAMSLWVGKPVEASVEGWLALAAASRSITSTRPTRQCWSLVWGMGLSIPTTGIRYGLEVRLGGELHRRRTFAPRQGLCWCIVCERGRMSVRPKNPTLPKWKTLQFEFLDGWHRPHGGQKSAWYPNKPPAATPSDSGGCCFLNGSVSYKSRTRRPAARHSGDVSRKHRPHALYRRMAA
jgi:hypothetical protein